MNRARTQVTAVTLACVMGSSAFAQQPPPGGGTPPAHEGEDAAARLLYERGAEAMAAGDYPTALDRFQQAYDLSHRPGLLYNIGTTLDRMRRDRDALAAFDQFLAQVPEHPRRSEVEARATALRAAIARQDAEEAERQARLAEERQRQEEERLRLEEERRLAEERRLEAERRAAEASDGTPPAIVYSLGGAAVVGGVLGVVFGVRTNNLNDDYTSLATATLNDPDGSVSDSDYAAVRNAHSDALTSQRITNIAYFSAAGFAAGAAVLAIFTDWDGDSGEATEQTRLVPVVSAGPNNGFFGLQRRF